MSSLINIIVDNAEKKYSGKRMSDFRIISYMIKGVFLLDVIFGVYLLGKPCQADCDKEIRKQCAILFIIVGVLLIIWLTMTSWIYG